MKSGMSKPVHSDAEWRRLIKVEKQSSEERRRALLASQEAMEKVLNLEHHQALLHAHSDDFNACDSKEISNLVELDCREAEEIAHIEKERVAALAANQICLAHEVEELMSDKGGLVSGCSASSSFQTMSSPARDGGQTRVATSKSPTPTRMIASTNYSPSTPRGAPNTLLAADVRKSPPTDDAIEPTGSSPLAS